MVFLSAAVLPLEASAQAAATANRDNSTTIEADKQRLLRTINFGNRELLLPLQLHNDELAITNDKLDINNSKLEDRTPDTGRLVIDQYELEESKATIELATTFAQVWSMGGDPDLQGQLAEFDRKLDDANQKCHPEHDAQHPVTFETIEDVQTACSDLNALNVAVEKYHIATPNGWLSVFKNDPGFKGRVGFAFFTADTRQLKRDEASLVTPKIKKELIRQDQSLIRSDKQIWLVEISSQDTVAFNARHPDHPMAGGNEIMDMMMKFRQNTAEIGERFRNAVLKGHNPND
jgi:hypothetical protein